MAKSLCMLSKTLFTACCLIPVALMAQGTFKITTGTTLKLTGGAIITVDNMHLDNDGTVSLAAGDGSFRFSGNTSTNILGSNMPLFDAIEIVKTNGAQLMLQRNISVVSGITFTSGLFNLNNNNILLQPTALLNGETETSRITGTSGGFVEITRTLNAPASINPGNLGAIITSSQNLGNTIIRRGHKSQTNSTGTGNSVFRYYDITPANNASLNAVLRFHYFNAELNGLDENSIVFWKSFDNVNWTNQGFNSRNSTTNYVEKSGIDGFSRWTLSSPNNPLPVQFVLFNLRCEDGRIILTWKTAQEFQSSHFNIETSTDGSQWQVIGSVQAAGNSNTEKLYSFTYSVPVTAGTLFRIAEHDVNGNRQFTNILRSVCGAKDSWKVWPNPVDQLLWLNIVAQSGSGVTVRLFDSKGALVKMQQNTLLPGSNQLNMDMKMLSAGMYHITIEWANGQHRESFRLFKK